MSIDDDNGTHQASGVRSMSTMITQVCAYDGTMMMYDDDATTCTHRHQRRMTDGLYDDVNDDDERCQAMTMMSDCERL